MSSKRKSLSVLFGAFILAMNGCSQGGSGESSLDVTRLNVDVEAMSADGCLNLERLRNEIASFPEAARVRRWSTSYDLQPLNEADAIRRGFLALSAFSNYIYSETGTSAAVASAPELTSITQLGCESVTMKSDIDGSKTYRLTVLSNPPSAPPEGQESEVQPTASVQLEADDGSIVVWNLVSSREIEITTKSQVMDPCPHYAKATAASTVHIAWGASYELDSKPALISRKYLRTMSTAVLDMPDGLLGLATNTDTDELVPAAFADLAQLKVAQVDPQIHQCPYRANPPSGDEPPPSSDDGPARPPEPEVPEV